MYTAQGSTDALRWCNEMRHPKCPKVSQMLTHRVTYARCVPGLHIQGKHCKSLIPKGKHRMYTGSGKVGTGSALYIATDKATSEPGT